MFAMKLLKMLQIKNNSASKNFYVIIVFSRTLFTCYGKRKCRKVSAFYNYIVFIQY